ncbi:MAG: penicillin-binding protein 1B [Thiotrichales bacterium]|nr:penicillin-binding protein 1B [Thiotrichales bacterium]MBT3613399.1 penicillin-binding protein 1B [Thiotrichales bacterium]MBT3752498.1 penicillin-binding protein 1B [Thiotrichales bacterium]MBT3837457.1 penicillin-binding protein 1B [Thiotrichales bacterium]MBT4151440.1 penicillin-binding protein 1B [Thiotrichales bacterium]
MSIKSKNSSSKKRGVPKKRVSKKSPPKQKTSPILSWRAPLRSLFILLLPPFILYILWLDYTVRSSFEGKQWDLPAQVFAAPLELYVGKDLTPTQLVNHLDMLGYRKHNKMQSTGTYMLRGDVVSIYRRPFNFQDGYEAARVVELSFGSGSQYKIKTLRSSMASGENIIVGAVRLDPLQIGSFHPAHGEDRMLTSLDAVPEYLVKALLVTEDRNFSRHIGISPLSIVRATIANIRAGRAVQGGSTLTQQLVKNLFLTPERTILRKLNEALISLILEYRYQKWQILESYLNEVYWGQDIQRSIHGVETASRFLFGHGASDLTLAESALMVGMLKGPSRYNPRRHPKRAKKRRNLVLTLMQREGVISEGQMISAQQEAIVVTKSIAGSYRYPAFLELVRAHILEQYPREELRTGGLQIFSSLDPLVQDEAEQALIGQIKRLEQGGKSRLQGAVVVADYARGEIEAIVGGRNPRDRGFNRALNALRPIGSLVKPPLFLAALEMPQRYTLLTQLEDRDFSVESGGKVWNPKNYDHKEHGQVPLYKTLSHSYNLSTARTGSEIGIENVADILQSLGVERNIPLYPSLFLGALELSPVEVTEIYQPIANGGVKIPLRTIRAVLNSSGKLLSRYPMEVNEVASSEAVSLLQWGMQEVVRNGTARSLNKTLSPHLNLAGKTGTSDELRDSWFSGFSGNHLAVVWMGRDDNSSAELTGASGALKVWEQLFSKLKVKPLKINYPEGVKQFWVDSVGGRAYKGCNGSRFIPFIKGSEPEQNGCN